jgi:hypothetical protein
MKGIKRPGNCSCIYAVSLLLIANTAQTQTHKVDSIRNNLNTLEGREAVNSLNAIGWQFYYHWIHADSALKYASLARQKLLLLITIVE